MSTSQTFESNASRSTLYVFANGSLTVGRLSNLIDLSDNISNVNVTCGGLFTLTGAVMPFTVVNTSGVPVSLRTDDGSPVAGEDVYTVRIGEELVLNGDYSLAR